MIDGNTVTSQYIKGENAFVEFNWEAMKVNLKKLEFTGELAFYKDKASQGYTIRVMGSHNGKNGKYWVKRKVLICLVLLPNSR